MILANTRIRQIIFSSLAEASQYFGLKAQTILKCIETGNPCKGFYFDELDG